MADTTYAQWYKHMEELRESLRDLTTEEAMKLSPAKIRASNDLYEALKEAIEYFKRLSDEGHYPEFMLSENGGHGYSKLKDALAKADGGK